MKQSFIFSILRNQTSMIPQNLSSKLWAMALLLLGLTTLSQAQVLQNLPRLKVEGPYMVDPQGNRVALRGVNVTASPQQQYWDMGGEVATVKESIRRATENNRNGANLSSTLIRFAMYPNRWGQRCCNKPGENNTQKWTPAFQAEFEEYVDNKLDQYVQYCKQRGAYILIDMHYISDANPVIKTSLMNYWPYLAKKYKDSDWVLFGLFNEPIRVYDGKRWSYDWLSFRNWAQPVVDEIRNHGDNIVMVGGLSWSKIFNEGTATSVINRPIQGGNIVYDYHVYSPFYCKNGGQLNVQRLNQTIGETITKYPVLYGEFGWYGEPGCVAGHSGTCQSYGQPLKEWTDNPNRRQKISWTPWSYSHQSGPTMLTSDGQLTDCNAHGTFIRDWLWERRNSDNPCVNCQPAPTKQTAYQGPHQLPGTLQAEHFDEGGQGVAYNDDNTKDGAASFRAETKVDVGSKATASNGYSVGWTRQGEWLEYTLASVQAGSYDITLTYATGGSAPGDLALRLDGQAIGTFTELSASGDWNAFTTTTLSDIKLSGGSNQVLRLSIVNGANFDIDAVTFALQDEPEPTTSLPQVGQTIWLQSRVTGQYVTVSNGLVYANGSNNTTASQHFEVTQAENGSVRLRSLTTNQYVQAISGSPTSQLTAQGGTGGWTQWQLEDAQEQYIRLQSLVNTAYMMADNSAPGKAVTSNGGEGNWAQFSWGISSTGGRQMTHGIKKQKLTTIEEYPDQQISVYPNPGSGVYQLKLGKSTKVRVMDMVGRVVYKHHHHSGTSSLNLLGLRKGLYVLVVEDQQFKLIKE